MAIIKPNNNTISAITALPAAIPTGEVLQVVTGTSNTQHSTTSTSYVNTNLSAAITPSATNSKVLIMITGTGRSTDSAGTSIFTLAKGSTNLVSGDGMARINQPADNELIAPVAMTLLDSPNTTSATTYRVQSKTSNVNNSAIFGEGDTRQTMILMEIGA